MKELLLDRIHLFEPNDYMGFYLEITKVDTQELKEAVQKAYENNEATCSRIILTKHGRAFFEKMDKANCRVELTTKSWQQLMSSEEKKPFSLKEGELVRTYISQYETKTGLFILAHHLVGDGKAMICFINDVMNALSGKTLIYKPLQLLGKEIPKGERLNNFVHLFVRFCNGLWDKTFSWDDYEQIHHQYWKNHQSKMTYYTFSEEETKKICDYSKSHHASVNTFLVSTMIPNKNKTYRIGMMTSLREKGNETMANLVTAVRIKVKGNKKVSLDTLHKNIQTTIQKKRYFIWNFITKLSPSLMDGVLLCTYGLYTHPLVEGLSRLMGYQGKKQSDLGLTNLTVLDLKEQYGPIQLKKVLVMAPKISFTKKVICASTFQGRLTLVSHDMDEISPLLRDMVNEIKAHIQ